MAGAAQELSANENACVSAGPRCLYGHMSGGAAGQMTAMEEFVR